MRRYFLGNILFVIGVNVLIKPIWILFIDRTVQNRLGAATYGNYQTLTNLAIIFQILMDFGLTAYNTRVVSQDKSRLPVLFPSFFWARAILTILYIIVVLTVGWLSGYRGHEILLLGGVMVIQAFNSLVLFLRSCIAALHRFKVDSLFSILDKILVILICGAFLTVPALSKIFNLDYFIGAQQLSYAITALLAFYVLTHFAGVRLSFTFNASLVLQVIKGSLPYAILILLMGIYLRSDMLLLNRLYPIDNREPGYYYAGFRLLDAANILGLSMAGILLPLLSTLISERKPVQPILKISTLIILPITAIAAVISWLYGQDIMSMLMQDISPHSGQTLGLLMLAFPAYSIMYIYSTLLTARGSIHTLIKFAAIAVLINYGINFWLIPYEGAVGAAKAAVATQWFMALACIITSIKLFRLTLSYKTILQFIAYVVLLITGGYGIGNVVTNWQLASVLIMFWGTLLFLVLGLLPARDALNLIKRKRSNF